MSSPRVATAALLLLARCLRRRSPWGCGRREGMRGSARIVTILYPEKLRNATLAAIGGDFRRRRFRFSPGRPLLLVPQDKGVHGEADLTESRLISPRVYRAGRTSTQPAGIRPGGNRRFPLRQGEAGKTWARLAAAGGKLPRPTA